jgi:hypothetical protein
MAEVTGGTGNYAYEWKNPSNTVISTTRFIRNIPPGIYTLSIHDGSNCPSAETVGIVSTDGPQVNVKEVISTKCSYSSDGSGLLEVTAGDGPFQFLWPNGQNTALGTNLPKGQYNVTITDKNNCATVTQVEIPAPEILKIISLEKTMPSCYGDCDGKIKVESQGGVGSYSYDWGNQSGAQAVNLCVGNHTVTVMDANACTHAGTFTLEQPDILQLRVKNRELPLCHGSCDGSIEVEASGGNDNYKFTWSSGSNISFANNICSGDHIVKLSDSKNCMLERTITLGQPEQLQVKLTKNQSPICHDGCDGALEVQAFGGTGTHYYTWSNGANGTQLNNQCPANYTLTATDDNACKISQLYTIENPPALIIDLGGSITLCTGQTHMLDAGSNWSAYEWRSNTGLSNNTSKITLKDAGQYWIEVFNADGCIAQDTFLLETSSDLLKASFLIPREALAGDTIAIIDISWPLPESAIWSFPSAMSKVLDLGDMMFGKFKDPGIYEISLTTRLGECRDVTGKTILILKDENSNEGGRLGYSDFVKEFTLYPNPTNGDFDIYVEFTGEAPATVTVWDTSSGNLLRHINDSGKQMYRWHIDLRPVSSGVYVIRLDHSKGKRYLRFIVY